MSNKAIIVEGISKEYRLGAEQKRHDTFQAALVHTLKTPFRRIRSVIKDSSAFLSDEKFWALNDIHLEINKGEVVGLIGRNGAGKSTLLKVLSRITKPTKGRAIINGRLGSLLEVGTGFHPELSGRENVFLNGTILGMKRHEIASKFDEIVAFAEVEKFIDTQVKHYSSGMYLRLAFAVAAHLETEILLVDEVLAVGDAQFQKKCLGKMGDVANEGRTVVFVSHNMGAIQALCKRTILIESGHVIADGPTVEVVSRYVQKSLELSMVPLVDRSDRTGDGHYRFSNLHLVDKDLQAINTGITGEDMYFALDIDKHIPNAVDSNQTIDIAIMIKDRHLNVITTLSSFFTDESPKSFNKRVYCKVPRLPLLADTYYVDLWCATSSQTHDYIYDAATFAIEPGDYYKSGGDLRQPVASRHGTIVIPHNWHTDIDIQ